MHMFTGFHSVPTLMEFIVSVWQLKALGHLIKHEYGMHKYKKINSIIHCYSYLVIQSKVTCIYTHTQRLYVCKLGWMCNLTHTCSQVFVHAPTQMEFIGHVQWLETLSHLIKQQHGKHKYIMIIHYYSYLVKWNWHTLKHNALALTESPSRAHTHVDCVCKLGWICNPTHVFTGFCVHAPTNIKLIVCIRQLKACFCLIKQQQGMHKYTKIFNIIMHYYTYLIIQSKVKLTPTERQQPCTQSHLQARAHMHVCIHPPLHTHT